MATGDTSWTSVLQSLAALISMLVGTVVYGYGLLVVTSSVVGGVHVAAIGASLFLAGLFSTTWTANRFDITPRSRRRLSLLFAALAFVLAAALLALSYAAVT